MKIGAIVQARFFSTRLPGKILKELPYASGITVLAQVVRRLKRSKKINTIIIATTTQEEDERIVNIAKKEKVKFFRGSQDDVLARYYFAAKEFNLDIAVRVTSDCPCIDPKIVDSTIKRHIQTKADFTANNYKRSYPHGLCVEVFNFATLGQTYRMAQKSQEREHVSPYIYNNRSAFKISSLKAPKDFFAPDIRITLDTEEDYALLCAVFDYLYPIDKYFKAQDIIRLFKRKPWLKLINKKIIHKKTFDNLEEEIQEAVRILDLQDLKKARDILRLHS